jgi:hypothetical protein
MLPWALWEGLMAIQMTWLNYAAPGAPECAMPLPHAPVAEAEWPVRARAGTAAAFDRLVAPPSPVARSLLPNA